MDKKDKFEEKQDQLYGSDGTQRQAVVRELARNDEAKGHSQDDGHDHDHEDHDHDDEDLPLLVSLAHQFITRTC